MQESRSKGYRRQRLERPASTTDATTESETEEQSPQEGAKGSRTRRIRERERPEPSVVWQTVAIFLSGAGLAAGLGALTLSEGAMITRGQLWLLTGAFVTWAATCFLAHWDVNRGRKIKRREVEEVHE
jgi:hypothetical protein